MPQGLQGNHEGSTQGPAVHPRSPRDTPTTPKVTLSLPKSYQRTPKVPQSNPQEVMYQLRANAWCACFTGESLF